MASAGVRCLIEGSAGLTPSNGRDQDPTPGVIPSCLGSARSGLTLIPRLGTTGARIQYQCWWDGCRGTKEWKTHLCSTSVLPPFYLRLALLYLRPALFYLRPASLYLCSTSSLPQFYLRPALVYLRPALFYLRPASFYLCSTSVLPPLYLRPVLFYLRPALFYLCPASFYLCSTSVLPPFYLRPACLVAPELAHTQKPHAFLDMAGNVPGKEDASEVSAVTLEGEPKDVQATAEGEVGQTEAKRNSCGTAAEPPPTGDRTTEQLRNLHRLPPRPPRPRFTLGLGHTAKTMMATGRSLKVDPGGVAQTQSTFSGEGWEFGIYIEAVSMHAEGSGFETQSTFTPNPFPHGIYFYRPAGKRLGGRAPPGP